MNFLSIDCSTDLNSLFIKHQSKTYSKTLQSDKSNYDLLMKHILDFFSKNNLKLEDINEIFVNQGPGSFSGLRSSISVAKGISLSKNLNLYGYNTFIWSCSSFFDKKDFIYCFIKSREKYYIKTFNKNLIDISKVEAISKEEILNNYENKFKVIPKNMAKYFDEKILSLSDLKVIDLDHKELEFLKLKGLLDKDLIKPLYLS
jgi:tRNA threonylcarbamoyl adenosine modification protein YeaZ